MSKSFARALAALFLLALFVGMEPARAETPPLDTMLESVQRNYRTAAFYCRIKSISVAGIELAQMKAKWKIIAESQKSSPPTTYTEGWDDALSKIQDSMAKAQALLDQGEPQKAYGALEDYASTLSELRRRNGMYNFTDRVLDFNAQRERWIPYRKFDEDLTDGQYLEIREILATMDFIVEGMDRHAPATHRADPTFPEAIDGLRQSLKLMRNNLDTRNQRGVKGSIRDINSSFFLLFLKFG